MRSDRKLTLDIARQNVERNTAIIPITCNLQVVEADWDVEGSVSRATRGCDVVLAADCVYEGDDGFSTGYLLIDAIEEALHTTSKVINQ